MEEPSTEYQDITRSEWKKSLAFIGFMVAVTTVSAFALIPDHWLVWTMLVVATIIVVVVVAVRGAGDVLYKCPTCGQEFEISAFKSAVAPHGVTKKDGKWFEWKHLECPMCHGKSRMIPVKGK